MRADMQIIFQDPYASLNPRMTIGEIIAEPLNIQKRYKTQEETRAQVLKVMEVVGLNTKYYNRYPHEFSGGQRQRIGIARAIVLNPSLVVCDEPVSALDVSIQSQVLNLLRQLQESMGMAYIFISHNLSVIKHISDRVMVMYLGHVVELADKKELFATRPIRTPRRCCPQFRYRSAIPRGRRSFSRAICRARQTRRPDVSSTPAASWLRKSVPHRSRSLEILEEVICAPVISAMEPARRTKLQKKNNWGGIEVS